MTCPALLTPSRINQWIGFCLLTGAFLTGVGCASRSAYDRTRAEADELTRTLEAARIDVRVLDQHIEELQAVNRREDGIAAELHAAIRREQDLLPILRQRADDKLASLQAQVANLVSHSRVLARQVAEAQQESASLQALVIQYKQEIEESHAIPEPFPSAANAPMLAQPPMTATDPSMAPVDPAVSPQQTAQTDSVTPANQTIMPHPAKVEPVPVDDSWTGMIMSWLSSLWSWIFN